MVRPDTLHFILTFRRNRLIQYRYRDRPSSYGVHVYNNEQGYTCCEIICIVLSNVSDIHEYRMVPECLTYDYGILTDYNQYLCIKGYYGLIIYIDLMNSINFNELVYTNWNEFFGNIEYTMLTQLVIYDYVIFSATVKLLYDRMYLYRKVEDKGYCVNYVPIYPSRTGDGYRYIIIIPIYIFDFMIDDFIKIMTNQISYYGCE